MQEKIRNLSEEEKKERDWGVTKTIWQDVKEDIKIRAGQGNSKADEGQVRKAKRRGSARILPALNSRTKRVKLRGDVNRTQKWHDIKAPKKKALLEIEA